MICYNGCEKVGICMDLVQLYCKVVIKPLESHLAMLEQYYHRTHDEDIAKLIEKTELKKQHCYQYLEELIDDCYR